jgi:antibiotic biosynthesis monooxygenase (ABM) superfamily enzyme
MDPSSKDSPRPKLELRGTGASAVIVQRVPADKVERFLELQHGIVEAAQGFPGYQKVDIYPPARRAQVEWVVVIHFDNGEALQHWLDAPVRTEWIARFHNEIGESRLKQVPAGFTAWFTGLVPSGEVPPRWKVALSVLLPLYPTVMVLSLIMPRPDRFGMAVTMLVSNILSVCILQWALTPALNVMLVPWLRASGTDSMRVTLAGLVLILATLGAMTALFSLVTG